MHFYYIYQEIKIDLDIACKSSDNFSEVENKIYIEIPELMNKNLFFLKNGYLIKRNATLEENKIKDDCVISIMINEDI